MNILFTALTAAFNIILQVVLNPLFLLVLIGTLVLFGLSKVKAWTWAMLAWTYWYQTLGNLLNDFKGDPVAFGAICFVCSVNVTIGIVAVCAYFVVRQLKLKI